MVTFIPKKAIVHHSLTRDSSTVSWGAIRKYHTKTLGWSAIGYHCGVELIKSGDEVYYEVLMGRMWDTQGAHTKGHNQGSLGICFVGNYDIASPTEALLKKGAEVIALWLRLFGLTVADIYSHHNFSIYKTCPGTLFDMERLRVIVRGLI